MDNKFKIRKYIKFSLAANIILNNSIFAGCNKKGNKENNKNGYSGKGNKSTENNITSDEEQHKNETPKDETPNNPGKQNKDYKKEIAELLEQLSNIKKNNDYLPEKKIDLNKEDLENEIKSIDSDKKVNNIKIELNKLESELNKNLNELKNDYNNRLQEITEGNTKLGLKLDINLAKEDIDNLDFNKNTSNINDVKTKLEALETQYFGQLELKCKDLKTKYDNLVKDKDNLGEGDIKEQVKILCNLTDENFKIKNYNDFKNLNSKIDDIESLIKGDVENLKNSLEERYNNYSNINTNLSLNITDLADSDLSNKINNFKIAEFSDIDTILDQIYKSIIDNIKNLNDNLKKKYDEINKKIGFFNSNTIVEKINHTSITINITEKTDKTNYDKITNDINSLKTNLDTKLNELKNNYISKIANLNTNLKSLGLAEIGFSEANKPDNLTFEGLNNKIIQNIETVIREAENKCKETIETFKKECTNSLKQVKTECNDDDIFNNFSSDINTITDKIKSIKTTENKKDVDILISELETKIKEAKKKAAEEEAKKKKEEEGTKKKAADKGNTKEEENKKKGITFSDFIVARFKDNNVYFFHKDETNADKWFAKNKDEFNSKFLEENIKNLELKYCDKINECNYKTYGKKFSNFKQKNIQEILDEVKNNDKGLNAISENGIFIYFSNESYEYCYDIKDNVIFYIGYDNKGKNLKHYFPIESLESDYKNHCVREDGIYIYWTDTTYNDKYSNMNKGIFTKAIEDIKSK